MKIGGSIEVSLLKPVAARLQGEATDLDMFDQTDDLLVINKKALLSIPERATRQKQSQMPWSPPPVFRFPI